MSRYSDDEYTPHFPGRELDAWLTDVEEWPSTSDPEPTPEQIRRRAQWALEQAHPQFSILITEKHAYIGTCKKCGIDVVAINSSDVVERFKEKLTNHACATAITTNQT